MSQDATAILFWGIDYSEDSADELNEKCESVWALHEEIYAAQSADREAVNPQPSHKEYRGPEWEAWRGREAELKAEQCIFDSHDSSDDPTWYAAAFETRNDWGPAKEMDFASMAVGFEWHHDLEVFCKRFNLPWREPKWYLAAYWG